MMYYSKIRRYYFIIPYSLNRIKAEINTENYINYFIKYSTEDSFKDVVLIEKNIKRANQKI